MKVVITGGHHTGALPVISELKKRVPNVGIYWIGHKYSVVGDKNPTLEYREITALNIPFYDLKAGKLYKTSNIIRILKVPFGIIQAFFYLTKIKPDIIMSFGGYLAAPVVFAGWFLRIPSITHEQTVVVGYANRFISHFAKKVLLTWGESAKYFKKGKIRVVGLPLRPEILKSTSDSFTINPGLPTVYITAGKTGSHIINKIVLDSFEELLQICNVIHQCGDTSVYDDYNMLKSGVGTTYTPGKYNLKKFVFGDEIGEVFSKADLVIGRSGAHIISELLTLEKPSILIPIPWASHNEQFENAEVLVEAGIARILEESNLTVTSLISEVVAALKRLDDMKIKMPSIKKVLVLNSAELIVDELLEALSS